MFIFKKKKLVVHCFTDRQQAATYAPIKLAHAFYPDWWKRLSKTFPINRGTIQGPTMKTCAGLRDLFQKGMILPMWCDLNIDVGGVGDTSFQYQFADSLSTITPHPAGQRGEFAPEGMYQHLKLISPWRFQCDEEIDFLWSEPVWNMQDLMQYRVLPGVLEYKHQHTTHINMLVPRKTGGVSTVLIPFNQPLVHIVPLTERELDIRVVEDAQKFKRLDGAQTAFINSYKLAKEIKKTQCPLGYGNNHTRKRGD